MFPVCKGMQMLRSLFAQSFFYFPYAITICKYRVKKASETRIKEF